MELSYKQLQQELKNLRDNQGFKLQCRLNTKKEVLKTEFQRITDIQSDMDKVEDTDTIVRHHFKGCPTLTTNVGNANVSEAIAYIDRNYSGSLIDEVIRPRDDFRFATVFAPKDNKYTVHSVVTALNLHGYQTTHDKDSVTIYDLEGWISISEDRLFFNMDATDNMKEVASKGYVPTQTTRFSVWYLGNKKEYEYHDSLTSLDLALEHLSVSDYELSRVDLRKEFYSEGKWKCIEHIELPKSEPTITVPNRDNCPSDFISNLKVSKPETVDWSFG